MEKENPLAHVTPKTMAGKKFSGELFFWCLFFIESTFDGKTKKGS